MLEELIISMRPKQWYKNLVLFVGIVFAHSLFNLPMLLIVISAFIIFCMISGSNYIINDILDMKRDRVHPIKCKRPIASGKLNKFHAVFFSIILIIVALSWSYSINFLFFIASIIFFLIHNIYTFILKHIVLVDVLTISTNFVIRAIAGAVVINVFVSPWLIITTFLLALFLALEKRRHELILLGNEAKSHRKILGEYSTQILDQMIGITTGAAIVSYSLYTFLTNNVYMMLTIPFAIYGFFRYLLLSRVKNFSGEEILFSDKGILICMVLWVILLFFVLYRFWV